MRITCANRTLLGKLDCLGEDGISYIDDTKKRITETNKVVESKQKEISEMETHLISVNYSLDQIQKVKDAKDELDAVLVLSHPGMIIAFDNIDMELHRKNMTVDSQNRTFHWVNHKMITNRVSGSHLQSDKPKGDVVDIPNIKFFPKLNDHHLQRSNYAILVSRIIVEYFDVFLKDVCIQHIASKYTKEMSQKSSKVHFNISEGI